MCGFGQAGLAGRMHYMYCHRAKGRLASFGSIDCTAESLAQTFNKWRECGAGCYAGKPRSEWAATRGRGLDAVISCSCRGVRLEKAGRGTLTTSSYWRTLPGQPCDSTGR